QASRVRREGSEARTPRARAARTRRADVRAPARRRCGDVLVRPRAHRGLDPGREREGRGPVRGVRPEGARARVVPPARARGPAGGAAGTAVFAKGGGNALARARRAAAESAGAEIRTGVDVTDVLVRDDRAVGVGTAGGETIEARAVVSSADPKRTLHMVDPEVL